MGQEAKSPDSWIFFKSPPTEPAFFERYSLKRQDTKAQRDFKVPTDYDTQLSKMKNTVCILSRSMSTQDVKMLSLTPVGAGEL